MIRKRAFGIGWMMMMLIVALAALGLGIALWSKVLTIEGIIRTGSVDASIVRAFTDDDDVLDDASKDAGDNDDCQDLGGVDIDGDGLTSCDPAASEDGTPDNVVPGPGPEPRYDKDVARCDASVDADSPDIGHILKRNVYPSYFCTAWFEIKNDGSIPVKVRSVRIIVPVTGEVRPIVPSTVNDFDLDGDTRPDVSIHVTEIEQCQQVDPRQMVQMDVDQHVLQDAPQGSELRYSVGVELAQWNEACLPELGGILQPGVSARVVGPGNLIEEPPPIGIAFDDGQAGEREPDEPPVEETRTESQKYRLFNTATGLEYEITVADELLAAIHEFRDERGLTSGTEGVDDPAVNERPSAQDGSRVAAFADQFVRAGNDDSSDFGNSGPPLGWSGGVDSRTIFVACPGGTPPCQYPWRTISQFHYVGDPEESRCSGTLIGPRHLYTAAHCINGQGTNNWFSFSVVPARDGAFKPFGESAIFPCPCPPGSPTRWYVTPVQWRTCDPDGDGVRDGDDVSCVPFDWGLIVIPDRLGSLTGWMGYVARPASELNAQTHYNRGYPCIATCAFTNEPAAQQPRRLYGDANACTLANYYSPDANGWNRVIHNSCDISGGHSGSAVYHYFFDPNLGKWVPVVSMVEVWENCFVCAPGNTHPNRSPRITPGVLQSISWLRQTFP